MSVCWLRGKKNEGKKRNDGEINSVVDWENETGRRSGGRGVVASFCLEGLSG